MASRKKTQTESTQPRPIAAERAIEGGLVRLRKEFVAGDVTVGRMVRSRPSRQDVIRDLDGRPLFYDVELIDEDAVTGVLRVAASETIGTSLIAVHQGPRRWDPDAALREARKVASKQQPKARILDADLVCYCYPKIGVRVLLETAGGPTALLLDAASLEPVDRFSGGELEGLTAYSYYAEVVEPTRDRRERRFAEEQEQLETLRKATPKLVETEFRLADREIASIHARLQLEAVYAYPSILFQQRVLPYSPRCGAEENFRLYAQQTNVFCAVAAGQMILDWHRWYFTQNQIAAAMNTGSGGTSNGDQVAGYQSLTNNSFVATYDTSAQWSEAKAEIDGGRPLKSGIPGHARTCNGYKRSIRITTLGFDYAVHIYDPWPWNANICDGGAVYWEDWDAVNHTNWIYVRHA
jgi:hypothetical protein